MIAAWQRADGRKGIRNTVAVAYLVECAHHVARKIVDKADDADVHLIGFPGCYPNAYAARVMEAVTTHPNVGGVVIVSLGCESFDRERLQQVIRDSGRPVELYVIQQTGGTAATIAAGLEAVARVKAQIADVPRVPMRVDELIVGTICGGSDGTSGITANPAVGRAFDRLVADGATCIFEETGELVGCEGIMADRALTPELGDEIVACVRKAEEYYTIMGFGSFAPGNAEGGLTTQEEKSMGAYSKSGSSLISGIIKPGDVPPAGGLYLLDVVPDGEPRFGFPNISDNAEIVEMIACGCHLTLFTTGRGSVVGSAIAPVIKICANPETARRLAADMDINAGRILEGEATLDEVGAEIVDAIMAVAGGQQSVSEALGHREFILTYKAFDPVGPACLPVAAGSR
ncbi:UxaA family hydrolase [Sphingomonas sp. 8AM]|uniref:UxaA family hydrolase n=1 Tax=Sphingomonas sp. 8AM TaxID=2653170 RepID=UPI0012EFC207|nr:UxaA family hydrolase [Sphingomonas sp. 8AM]VXC57469.1 Hydrolase [Sphingomonas sp. 8AM]